VNRDRKLSVLEALLARVRNRAASPRASAQSASSVAAPATPQAPSPPSLPDELPALAHPAAIASAPAATASAVSPVAGSPPEREVPTEVRGVSAPPRDELASEPPGPEPDEEEGPPSAPRLREGLSAADERIEDEEAEEREQEFREDEGPLKTPPPESGRQHVAAPPAPAAEASDELDIDISVTVTEGEATPSPVPSALGRESASPAAARGIDMGAPVPRLAFVSEPEIDLHLRPQASPVAPPSGAAAESRSEPASVPPVVPLPAAEHPPASSPPPVRLMTQPPVDAERGTAAPVEVWASTHAPSALRGQVASFVGQNASFAPKSFGELLDASLQLGES